MSRKHMDGIYWLRKKRSQSESVMRMLLLPACEGQNEQKRPFPSLSAKRLEQIIVLGSIFLSRTFNGAKVISFQWYHNKDVCPILEESRSWKFLETADYIIKCRHNASKEQKVRCWSEWSRGRLTNGVWKAGKVARWTSQLKRINNDSACFYFEPN